MYLSLLRLNPRSRRAMTEARRPYELHRTLMRAFPSAGQGGPGRVLFRLDINPDNGSISVIIQSEKEPDWSALVTSGDYLADEPQHKPFDPRFAAGQVLYFRLRANPTRRDRTNGKRLGILREEDQIEWLKRKGVECGFDVVSAAVIPEGLAHDSMTDKAASPHTLSLVSARLDGVLRVSHPDIFRMAIERGIGSGKSFGFGLLSVAPIKEA